MNEDMDAKIWVPQWKTWVPQWNLYIPGPSLYGRE